MPETAIEWATHVWNPFTGCDIVSAGCGKCYAKPTAASLKRREQGRLDKAEREGRPAPKVRYQNDGDPKTSGPGFGFTVHWDKLENPERFPAGARVFVNSMSDVFHEEAPDDAIGKIFETAVLQPRADFLILTKRPERMLDYFRRGADLMGLTLEELKPWPNVWLGVSIENRDFVHRADLLRQTPAAVRFISAEPLLGPLVYDDEFGGEVAVTGVRCWSDDSTGDELDLTDIDWLIVGGESGKGHRPIDPQWVRDLLDATRSCDPEPAFFFKQWGGKRAKEGGRDLDGRTWDEIPESMTTKGALT